MRRSISFCEPNVTAVGEKSNWKFVYSTANAIPAGALIKFELSSKGRAIDWQIPQTNPKKKENLIWGELPNKKTVKAELSTDPKTLYPYFEFVLPSEVKAGEDFVIHVGSPDGNPENGNTCQRNVQRKRNFKLSIDPKGKGDYSIFETFHMDVRGSDLKKLRIITPSLVIRNKRFDVIVRFEDAYGNLTSKAPEGTLIDLSYEHLRENLNWKLFVPETGFITLPNLYFNEEGIYKIRLKNLHTGEIFFSPPIKCVDEEHNNLFWGLLHGESERFDSAENIESCLRYFRDEKALHFFSTSSFDSEKETPPDIWKNIVQQVGEFNEEDRFVALLGSQWVGEKKEEGVRQFIHTKEVRSMIRKKDTKTNSLKKIYKVFQSKDLLSIPSFTMGENTSYCFEDYHPEFERVAEIYNAWGASECLSKHGNPRPIGGKGSKSISESGEGSLQNALNQNCRFGFVAGGFDDRGIYEDFYDSNQSQYSAGLTAVLSKDHSRSSIIDALFKRSCYATTGARIIIGFFIAGSTMGSEINSQTKPGLAFNRHLSGYVIGTEEIDRIEIIRNGEVYQSIEPKSDQYEFAIDDLEPLEKVSFPSAHSNPPFSYYYLRVTQKDGQVAWSSPIWVDSLPPLKVAPSSLKKKKK